MDTVLLAALGWDQWIVILIGIGVVAFPWREELISKGKSLWEKVDMSDKDDVKPVKAEKEKDLSNLVDEWEEFVDVLVDYGLTETAKEMKALFPKMCAEYRPELDDKPEPPAPQ